MRSADQKTSEILARFVMECARATHEAIVMDVAGPHDFTDVSYSYGRARQAMANAREALRFLFEALGGPKLDTVCKCALKVRPGRHIHGCPAAGSGDLAEIADACAFCGVPFRGGETRTLRPDGSSIHEATQPESMSRCRDELTWQRDHARRVLDES